MTRAQDGFALVAVLIVLAALLALSAPFLASLGEADEASARLAEEAQARLALDAAARHARALLGASHAALDPTPASDGPDELALGSLDPAVLDHADPFGVMWGASATDLSGRIDPASAPPQLFASLLGALARLSEAVGPDDERLPVASSAGLAPAGLGWLEGELVRWSARAPDALEGVARGVAADLAACGPAAAEHVPGALLLGEAAWALARWRLGPEGLRAFDGLDRVAAELAAAGADGADALARLARTTSVHAAAQAGARWQRGARVLSSGAGEERCRLQLDDARWFNAGTTVRIEGPAGVELSMVRSAGVGFVELVAPPRLAFGPLDAVVAPLARVPVNLNTASDEVLAALFENLQLVGAPSWITAGEARELARRVVEARPLAGFEDFLRRVVLPAAGLSFSVEGEEEAAPGAPDAPSFLERADAEALYRNGLNANDAALSFSTMPFAFASRDVYALELRAAVNAPSGALVCAREREDVALVVPQRDLLGAWTRQSELDAAARLDGAQGGWTSGPRNTLRADARQRFGRPSEARAHWGGRASEAGASARDAATPGPPCFPDAGEEGWVQLAPARADERDTPAFERAGRVLHFDDDPDPEGRALDDSPLRLAAGAAPVAWLDDDGLLAPFALEGWFRLRTLASGALLLDVAGAFSDSDRVSLGVEDGALVLRVLGPAPDHPATRFEERTEARLPLAAGPASPGLPADTWVHVACDVRGDRPDQVTLLVDGRAVEEGTGLTRLAAPLRLEDERILVRSTEGFPERCVLAIGHELVEAVVQDAVTFRAVPHETGELSGFGGRLAREVVFGHDPATNLGEIEKGGTHAAGEAVALYGYSLAVAERVPAASGRLASALGPFGVARVRGVLPSPPEPIFLQIGDAQPTNVGWGMKGANSRVTALVLDVADPGADKARVLAAFSERGGYAALLGFYGPEDQTTSEGDRLSFLEVVHYSRRQGDTLHIDRRGDQVPELANLAGSPIVGRCAWIVDWNDGAGGVSVDGSQLDADERLELQTLIVPISLAAGVQGGGVGFYDSGGASDFAQVTRLGADAALTEWVRYDEIVGGELVRDDPATLLRVRAEAHAQSPVLRVVFTDPGGPVVFPQDEARAEASADPAAPAPPARAARAPSADGPPLWQPALGTPEDDDLPLTRALASALRFRGVLGTHSHAQPAGALVLPVWKVVAPESEKGGWPGRLDAVTLFDADPELPGFPGVVQHAYRPFDTVLHHWRPSRAVPLGTEPLAPSTLATEDGFDVSVTYVALQGPPGVPIVPGGASQGPAPGADSRRTARVTLFPAGELPRAAATVALGGSAQAGSGVPDALADEVVFGRPRLQIQDGGAQLELAQPLARGETAALTVHPDRLLVPQGERLLAGAVPALLPGDAFLARVGQEIVCARADGGGRLALARGGRGLLGSEATAHAAGEPVTPLPGLRVARLAGALEPESALVPLADASGFPESGLVRIEDELVHYTHRIGDALAMPRASLEPGRCDGRGPGLFRGRFGTEPAAHQDGVPVILFPFRYPDRWAERADAPELASLELSLAQPAAFWRQAFWEVEEPAGGGPELGILQRSRAEVPWDAPPRAASGLEELSGSSSAGAPDAGDGGARRAAPLGFQADGVTWRVFARHARGAFDPRAGLSHAWKTTPRLHLLGAEWFAPSVLLARVER